MKIGDIFTDENRRYEVVGFASDMPVAKFIGFAQEEFTDDLVKAGIEEVKPVITAEPVKDNYEDMQYAQLKKLCAEKGVSAKGSKQDLIDRLRG